jgi:hypothetical protein
MATLPHHPDPTAAICLHYCPDSPFSGTLPSILALALDSARPPHSSLRSASSWRTVFVSPSTTVVASALACVSDRQPSPVEPLLAELLALALLLDVAVASPAWTGRIDIGSMCDMKPARMLIVPTAAIRDQRPGSDFCMI